MTSDRRRPGEKCRLLIVGTHLSKRGGHRTPSEDLRDRLQQNDEFEVFSCSDRHHGVTRMIHTWIMIARHWGRLDLAIIDVFSGRAFLLAELASAWARRSGARTVLSLHGGGLPAFAERASGRIERLLSSADAVTSPSPFLAERFSGVRKIDVIPNPIHIDRFQGVERAERAPGEVTSTSPRLLWVRALHAIYRPWDAVEVLHLISSAHPSARLTLIGADKGDGSLERIHETARNLGVSERVELRLGVPHTEIPHALGEADVFLNTTTIDNTPLSVLEALAARLPVVTTDVGGIPHLVDHEGSAMMSPVADPEAMAANVLRVLDEPGLADHLRTYGLAVATEHDWSRVWPKWCSLIAATARARV